MTPTPEQITAWAREAWKGRGAADHWFTECQPHFARFAALAFAAGAAHQAEEKKSDERQALDMLAGLHPCLTVEHGAIAEAEAIFNAVTSREAQLKCEIQRLESACDSFRAAAIRARTEQTNEVPR